MLDLSYSSLRSFVRDCLLCSYDPRHLLETGQYVKTDDGWIVAAILG